MKTLEEILKKEDWTKVQHNPSEILDRIVQEATSNEKWVTARGTIIPVNRMTTSHINNTIKCLNGKGNSYIPKDYLGGRDKWLIIFHNELIRRS